MCFAILRTCPFLSLTWKQCTHVHKANRTRQIRKNALRARLPALYYALAKALLSLKSPRSSYLPKSYFAAAFPFDSSLAALKTFETTEADSLSVLARVTVGKAENERIQSDLIKKAWMRPNAENLANCSR